MRRLSTLLVCALLAACGTPDSPDTAGAPADTMSKGARDSALARSRIPNAGAVGKAQGAAEAANQRTTTLDSIQQ